MYKNIMPYFDKIRKEEVEIDEKKQKSNYYNFVPLAVMIPDEIAYNTRQDYVTIIMQGKGIS